MIKINYRDTSKVSLNKKCLNKILFYNQDGCLLCTPFPLYNW